MLCACNLLVSTLTICLSNRNRAGTEHLDRPQAKCWRCAECIERLQLTQPPAGNRHNKARQARGTECRTPERESGFMAGCLMLDAGTHRTSSQGCQEGSATCRPFLTALTHNPTLDQGLCLQRLFINEQKVQGGLSVSRDQS